MEEFTYKKSGVDIREGDRFVKAISPLVRRTFRPEVMTDIGSFGALFKLDIARFREPVLVSGTDGVGTKLKIAFMADRHDTVGIDLVAMCANDVLTSGAEPLFFLDYFATGKLSTGTAVKVVEGIVRGCEEAGCSLIGGETAEMPGFYAEGEYDLSGFCVGVVERNRIVDGSAIREGDALIGIASNGLHSNGYSLVRKILFDHKKMKIDDHVLELKRTLGEELLRPTRIYVKAIKALKDKVTIKGMAHITGGGLPGNLPRVLPEGTRAVVREGSWPQQPIFALLKELGNVPLGDMRDTFNMGIGFVLVVAAENVTQTLETLRKNAYDCCIIGQIRKGGGPVIYE